jgi:hypothetical protein
MEKWQEVIQDIRIYLRVSLCASRTHLLNQLEDLESAIYERAPTYHPKPWSVKYNRRCSEWHEKSGAHVVDALGKVVTLIPQHTGHPGAYDAIADNIAHTIVNAVNGETNV